MKLLVFLEHHGGELVKNSLAVLSKGASLGDVDGVVIGSGVRDAAIAVLTSALPTKGTPNDAALRAMVPTPIRYVRDLRSS